jgi:aldose sugar dehydrogenase
MSDFTLSTNTKNRIRNNSCGLIVLLILTVILNGNFGGIDKSYNSRYIDAEPVQSNSSTFSSPSSSPPLSPTTPPQILPDFNFTAVGDWGCTPDTVDTLENILTYNPGMVLSLGDFSYKRTADCWFKIVDPIDEKMKIVIGNHDTETESLLSQYMNHFNLTNQYYSFDHKNIHFLVMSTEIPYEENSEQYNFVKNDLTKAALDPDINWIIVSFHKVAYSSKSLLQPIAAIRNVYHPLFEKYGVDLVLQGHQHNYQRTFPIKHNKDLIIDDYYHTNTTDSVPNPIISSKNLTYYTNPDGQVFVTVGTGGISLFDFRDNASSFTASQYKGYGFLGLKIVNNGTTMEAKFSDNNGSVKDQFTIVKSRKSDAYNVNQSAILHDGPNINYRNENYTGLTVETVYKGVRSPTNFAFLGPNDILVLGKNNGTVTRILDGKMLQEPLLDVTVANKTERGMLGIAVAKHPPPENRTYVFLYYTEAKGNKDGTDVCPTPTYCEPGNEPLGNRLYRYELAENGSKLINPKLLLDLPATPGPGHNGGEILIGPDKNLYVAIGDVTGHETKAQNVLNTSQHSDPDGTGGILRVTQDGKPIISNYSLGVTYPLNLYFAYGIRNSFGLDFDPLTGKLWDTENGPNFGDEINLVEPGFNSGWKKIQGIWRAAADRLPDKTNNTMLNSSHPRNLELFDGKGKYRTPELTWSHTAAPTAIKFLTSDKYGKQLENDLFVATFNNGSIYHFGLDNNRTSLALTGPLADKIASTPSELEQVTFAQGFSGIADMEVGPDGFLYLSSLNQRAIYRIVPINISLTSNQTGIIPNHISDGNVSESKFTVVDFGAIANDGKDDTEAFKDAISLVTNYTGLVYIPAGVYDIKEKISLPTNMTVEGENRNNTIIIGHRNGSRIFDAKGEANNPVTNITIGNLTMKAYGGKDTLGSCVHFIWVTNYLIKNTDLSGCGYRGGDATIYLGSTVNGRITNNTINIIDRGINIIRGHQIQITNNTVDAKFGFASDYGIKLSPQTDYVLIKDNQFHECDCLIRNEAIGNNVIIEQGP